MDEKMKGNEMEEIYKSEEEIPAELLEMITGGAGEEGYKCKYCGKVFSSITSVACHISSAHK